jgi:hypothetical protein
VTLWQMVAGQLPHWAEEQAHHHHHHHVTPQDGDAQQQGAGTGSQDSGSSGHCDDDDLVLPLEPAAVHLHTTPKDLQFPENFSKVSSNQTANCQQSFHWSGVQRLHWCTATTLPALHHMRHHQCAFVIVQAQSALCSTAHTLLRFCHCPMLRKA